MPSRPSSSRSSPTSRSSSSPSDGTRPIWPPTAQELTKDLTEIPGTPTVDDFFHQVTNLAVSAGDPNTPSISVTQSPDGRCGAE